MNQRHWLSYNKVFSFVIINGNSFILLLRTFYIRAKNRKGSSRRLYHYKYTLIFWAVLINRHWVMFLSPIRGQWKKGMISLKGMWTGPSHFNYFLLSSYIQYVFSIIGSFHDFANDNFSIKSGNIVKHPIKSSYANESNYL